MSDRDDDAGDDAGPNPRASWTVRVLGAWLGGALTVGALAEAADLYRLVGLVLYNEQRLVLLLGIAMAALFVVKPARRGTTRLAVPWYDAVVAVAGFVVCAYVAWDYERIFEDLYFRPTDAVVASIVIIVLVAEGLRRTAGNVLLYFMIFFIVFGLFGHYVPGDFEGRDVAVDRMMIYLGLDSNGLVGLPLTVSTTIVIAFIYFGTLLGVSGGSRFFTDISTALMGRYRGGSAKIAVTASSLFGSISGSAVSNVVSTGVITIPLMRQGGYPAHAAGAIEAVASTGGQLMPPMMGAAAFVMAEFLQIAYRDVVLAALIPAALYYVALFIQADLFAARDKIARVDDALIPPRWPVFKAGWFYIAPFAVVIVCLFEFNLRPETSALWAAGSLIPIGLFLGYKGERMDWRSPITTLAVTGSIVIQIIMIGAMAGVIIGVLNITGLGFALTQAIIHWAGGNLVLILALAAIISIVLGMGMPTLAVYLLLATLVIPSMTAVGIEPMAAHLFALYFGMLSMITPPVAIAAFAAATVANSDPIKTAVSAVMFGWSAYVIPFLFVVAPELLMQGPVLLIAQTAATAIAGIWVASMGTIGYLTRPLGPLMRILFVAAGLGLMLPASVAPWAPWTDFAGLVLGGALVAREILAGRRAASPAAAE